MLSLFLTQKNEVMFRKRKKKNYKTGAACVCYFRIGSLGELPNTEVFHGDGHDKVGGLTVFHKFLASRKKRFGSKT